MTLFLARRDFALVNREQQLRIIAQHTKMSKRICKVKTLDFDINFKEDKQRLFGYCKGGTS